MFGQRIAHLTWLGLQFGAPQQLRVDRHDDCACRHQNCRKGGGSRIPRAASTPAANGIATML
jgi:hypothetical protein